MGLRGRMGKRLRARIEDRVADSAIDYIEDNPQATEAEIMEAVTKDMKGRFGNSPLWALIAPILEQIIKALLERLLNPDS